MVSATFASQTSSLVLLGSLTIPVGIQSMVVIMFTCASFSHQLNVITCCYIVCQCPFYSAFHFVVSCHIVFAQSIVLVHRQDMHYDTSAAIGLSFSLCFHLKSNTLKMVIGSINRLRVTRTISKKLTLIFSY